MSVGYTKAGGVGHYVLRTAGGKLFVPPMKECHSVELTKDDIVVDIGAYCGTYTLWAAARARYVRAYEPTPRSFEVLKKNVSLKHNVAIWEWAIIGGAQPSASLYVSAGVGVTNSVTPKRGASEVIEVPAVNYKRAVREATVVKIDVEGAEYSYGDLAPWDTIRALIIDFHPIPGDREWTSKAESVIASIERKGFTPIIEPNWGNGWTRAGSWIRSPSTAAA